MNKIKYFFYNILLSILLISCSSPTQNFKKVLVKGGDFLITTYQKIDNSSEPYVFYIEGDGIAYSVNGDRPSANPTPIRKMLLSLAAMDKRPNIVYVARPCQYTPMELNPKCNPSYWTIKRFSDDSVSSINDVINKINSHQHKFSLIGYSGGGGIAVLVAARNNMVKDIITIAGNLDISAFTNHHKVSPMSGSLNPIDYAKLINNIPQLHLSGGKDKIIPPFIAEKYVEKSNSVCVKQKTFPNIDHKSGWDKVWNNIYNTNIKC